MKPINVLIIDDSIAARKIMEEALRRVPLEKGILEAANGVEAMAVIQQKPVDLIFCDICMPQMDGLEFLRQLRADEKTKHVPVVMISAHTTEKNVTEALAQGVNGFLKKPFTAQHVKDIVTRVLDIAA